MCQVETLVDKSLKEGHVDKLVDGYDSEAKSVTTEIDKTNVSENGSLCREIAHFTMDNTRCKKPVWSNKNKILVFGDNYAVNFSSALQKKIHGANYQIEEIVKSHTELLNLTSNIFHDTIHLRKML
ncbi:hypothetical protein JTB14_024560 [Gonioctena quinquepunctata]|nr:hypothetical protein JTB14_024560 [Gonioctena quinquepunctata]